MSNLTVLQHGIKGFYAKKIKTEWETKIFFVRLQESIEICSSLPNLQYQKFSEV